MSIFNTLDTSAGVRNPSGYLEELEFLRGTAFLLVFFFHVHGIVLNTQPHSYSLAMSFVTAGNTGVTLFFVLSGFLLSLPWLRFIHGTHPYPSVRNYYISRILRIIPLYYLAICVAVAVSGNIGSGVKALLFMPVGFDIFPFSVVWWTLTTEVQFYLLLPLLFWAWSFNQLTRGILIGGFALWLYAYTNLVLGEDIGVLHPQEYLLNKSLFGRMPAFLIGIASAGIYLRLRQHDRHLIRLKGSKPITGLLFIGLIWLLALILQKSALLGDFKAEATWHIHHTYEALLWALIILTLLILPLPGKSHLVSKPIMVIGKLSYSLYIVHVPLLFYLAQLMDLSSSTNNDVSAGQLFTYCSLSFALSLILAAILYRFIELPFLSLKKLLPVVAKPHLQEDNASNVPIFERQR